MEPKPRRPRPTTAVILAFVLVTCGVNLSQAPKVPPPEWQEARGPVVPHDSFPAECSLCHVGSDWNTITPDFTFDHAAETGVALAGAHEDAECLRCHNDRGPVALFSRRGCAGCHEDPHQGRLGTSCESCHNERDWLPREQDARHARTRFPLIGAHAVLACWTCHPGAEVGNFQRADTRCESCHGDDLQRATSPNHVAMGWTRDCQRCHTPTDWTGAAFNHSIFPLTGAHIGVDCSRCHTGGVFAGTPRDCFSCHSGEYTATTSPNHVAAGFSTSCESCHSTAAWTPAQFAHTTFPLTGAHLGADCSSCHTGGVFAGTPRNCVDCHLTEYNNTTSPNHMASGFPTSCESCHNTIAWQGATFAHPFPLRNEHNVSCTICHTNPTNFLVFTCLVCHEHRKSEMDDEHDEVPGYSYNSAACYSCHPNGR